MLLSIMLVSRIAFFGFAIGGWTGLHGYEQAIANARHSANLSIVYLLITQCVGGSLAFLALRRGGSIARLPLIILAYAGATFVIVSLYVEAAAVLHRSF